MTQPSPEAAERPAMADMTNWCVTHTSKPGRRREAACKAWRHCVACAAVTSGDTPTGEPSAGQTSALPKASRAVSWQRHQGLDRTVCGFRPRWANH